MKILITGGGGYLGHTLIDIINSNNIADRIIIYDNFSSSETSYLLGYPSHCNIEIVNNDILNTEELARQMESVDLLFHLAAHVHFPLNHNQNLRFEQINTWGTLSVVKAAMKSSTLKRAIYTSSSAVYGFRENIMLNSPPIPDNSYGISKYEGEKYFHLLSEKMNVNIYRLANVFGYNPSFRLDSVLNSFIVQALVNRSISVFGTGSQMRAFISLQDVCNMLVDGVQTNLTDNIGHCLGFCASMNDLIEELQLLIPDLNYTSVNQNHIFDSQSFNGIGFSSDGKSAVKKELAGFAENLRIHK